MILHINIFNFPDSGCPNKDFQSLFRNITSLFTGSRWVMRHKGFQYKNEKYRTIFSFIIISLIIIYYYVSNKNETWAQTVTVPCTGCPSLGPGRARQFGAAVVTDVQCVLQWLSPSHILHTTTGIQRATRWRYFLNVQLTSFMDLDST